MLNIWEIEVKIIFAISENMTVATNIDGGSAFMRIDTEGGRRSLFDIVDLTINAVETASAFSPKANANW